MSIWQLSKELQHLDDLIESEAVESGGEVSPELIEAFNAIADSFDAEGAAMLVRKLRQESEMFAAQAKRFKDVATHRKNAMKALQLSIMDVLDAKGVKNEGSLSVCKNGGKLPLVVGDKVPEDFIRYEPATDTDKIRAALDAGTDLPFAEYGERGRHLRVKG